MNEHRLISIVLVTFIAVFGMATVSHGQDLLSKPTIFVFKRPRAEGAVGKKQAYRNKGQRQRLSNSRNPDVAATASPASNRNSSVRPAPAVQEQIGVTMWKLRPEVSGETGARLLTMAKQSDAPAKFVAERIELDTTFVKGDKVRISVESPRAGYLYVVDRELKKNGTLGDPYLIFPTLRTRGGDNSVGAGMVIELPAQTDNPFYFDITPMEEDYAGEMLTILISPTKIEGLTLGNDPIKLPAALVAEWERKWEKPATAFELEGGTGQKYTEDEKVAGTGARQLTHKSPSPQSVLIVEAPKSSAYMVSFPMRVSQ